MARLAVLMTLSASVLVNSQSQETCAGAGCPGNMNLLQTGYNMKQQKVPGFGSDGDNSNGDGFSSDNGGDGPIFDSNNGGGFSNDKGEDEGDNNEGDPPSDDELIQSGRCKDVITDGTWDPCDDGKWWDKFMKNNPKLDGTQKKVIGRGAPACCSQCQFTTPEAVKGLNPKCMVQHPDKKICSMEELLVQPCAACVARMEKCECTDCGDAYKSQECMDIYKVCNIGIGREHSGVN